MILQDIGCSFLTSTHYYRQMTQGVYMSPMCPLKQDSQSVAGTVIGAEYGSEFERHLISYFQAYGPDLSALRKQVALYDWSQCKVITRE